MVFLDCALCASSLVLFCWGVRCAKSSVSRRPPTVLSVGFSWFHFVHFFFCAETGNERDVNSTQCRGLFPACATRRWRCVVDEQLSPDELKSVASYRWTTRVPAGTRWVRMVCSPRPRRHQPQAEVSLTSMPNYTIGSTPWRNTEWQQDHYPPRKEQPHPPSPVVTLSMRILAVPGILCFFVYRNTQPIRPGSPRREINDRASVTR